MDDDVRDDEALVAAIADGDVAALRVLYGRHAAWLSVRLARRCNDEEVVADVLQDTFVALWKQAASYRGDGAVGAWLWGIGVRRLVSRLRRRRDVVLLDAIPDRVDARRPAIEEQILGDVEHGDLAGVFARLSPEMRAVVQATVLDGLTAKEAGRLLGIPTNTVKTRLHRAKAQLRAGLVEEHP